MAHPTLPCRLSLSLPTSPIPSLGTLLFIGPVPPIKGTWYGVEWDDPSRGKHDGIYEKTGVRYFGCRVKGAGSFLRPTISGLSFGKPFRKALKDKYQPKFEEEGGEKSQFFETSFVKPIEVVPLGRVRERFKNLGGLKEVGLEGEEVVGLGEEGDGEEEVLTKLEVLNLSCCLLPSLEAASEIVGTLPALRVLSLNSNRFIPLTPSTPILVGFKNLTELNLNNTLLSWAEIIYLEPSLPSLIHLQLGHNLIPNLSPPPPSIDQPIFPNLKTLNLAENFLTNWDEITASLHSLPSLERLILSSNQLSFPPSSSPKEERKKLQQLRHLHLTNNLIKNWSEIDEISELVPELEGLRIGRNGFEEGKDETYIRLCIMARIPKLVFLEGSLITPIEREEAELFYLSQISKDTSTEDQKILHHKRWKELLTKYSQTTNPSPKPKSTIASKLIRLTLLPPSPHLPVPLQVLPHQPTRLLRTHFARLFGKQFLNKKRWKLLAILEGGRRIEIGGEEEGREIGWWGLGEGDEVGVEEV